MEKTPLSADEAKALSRVKAGLVIDPALRQSLIDKQMIVQLLGGLALTPKGNERVKPLL